MNTKTIALVATVTVIALVAIGIGYAYTATTSNTGNSAQPEYITLSQSGDGAYKFTNDDNNNDKFNVYFDTINTGTSADDTTTRYKLTSTTETMTIGNDSYWLVQIGKDIIINTAQTNGSLKDSISATFSTEGFVPTNGWCFVIKIAVNGHGTITSTLTYNQNDWSSKAFTIYKNTAENPTSQYLPCTVSVYYGQKVATIAELPTVAPSNTPLSNASILFIANTDEENQGTNHVIIFDQFEHGSATYSLSTNDNTTTATITTAPDSGYTVDKITAKNFQTDAAIAVSGSGNAYTLTMPADDDVIVSVTFKSST